jgi:hypothetical protein
MKTRFKAITFLTLLIIITDLSCKKEPPLNTNYHLGKPFQIKVGEDISLSPILSNTVSDSSLSVTFKNVLLDSRCNMSVCYLCYGGFGIIQIFFSHKQDTGTITLRIPGCRYEYECDDQLFYRVDTLGYRFCLLRLDPYPGDSISTNKTTYTAKLNISKH